MSYTLKFAPQTKKDLKKLPVYIQKFILNSLKEFANNFSNEYEAELIKTGKIKKLKGEWEGFYRLRLRTYRVIYQKNANELVILIIRISHRKNIYL
ncbi:type II toxin-antitoxin system RelE/ParE family toxin [Deferribacter autotrophicus]|uniref:Type II toxin-antitoxin system RelE/ParE family toxin n=1 Tax=Deferribacter autotrophicus TaxID=500465 RepID=A0A5A8F219_9BACT|nr:type II toxin-antitoxin system RelE/ParE family toxin [Deferribacter autotrophicus]KAA0257500.1 type II toxin-antitoxin system RelE/ParE family toxin [Deferribacter autotrophicus]